MWKYKSLIIKVIFENNIHDVVNSIKVFDISTSRINTITNIGIRIGNIIF